MRNLERIVSLLGMLVVHSLLGAQGPVEQALAWQDSTWSHLFSDEDRALGFLNQVLELEGQIPDTVLANSFNHLAIHHGLRYENSEARDNFQRAFDLMHGAPLRQAIIARNLGLILKDLHDFDAALAKIEAARALHDSLGDSRQLAMDLATLQNKVSQTIAELQAANLSHPALESLRRSASQDEFFEQFKLRFQGIHPGFDAAMLRRFPDLTANDLEFCQLLKLGLSNREIGELLNISPSSVMTRKYRLRKRMGLDEGERIETHLA